MIREDRFLISRRLVERLRDGSWVVTDGLGWLDAEGQFRGQPYDPQPPRECLHDKKTALRLAKQAAPGVTVNGITAAEAARRAEVAR